jgi:hypothetical protein
MIQFFAKRCDLVPGFFDSWAPESRSHVRSVPYEKFPVWESFPAGVCVFMDLERLEPDELSLAVKLSDALRTRPESYTVFNEPRRYLGRFNLLKMLHTERINEFQTRRIHELNGNIKFPVFLRNESDHDGPVTPLLHSRGELDRALAQSVLRDPSLRKHLIAIEFCDCSEGGVFRKYSAMKVGDALIPRHILFSKEWVTKKPDVVTEKYVAEEMDFIRKFPHAEQVAKVFQLAGLDYGRVDYGVRDGRIQVWEINTNPVIVPSREEVDPRRMPAQSESARRIAEAIVALSERHKNHAARPFQTKSFLAIKAMQKAQRLPKRVLKSIRKRLG